jgi:hypothetical protein
MIGSSTNGALIGLVCRNQPIGVYHPDHFGARQVQAGGSTLIKLFK